MASRGPPTNGAIPGRTAGREGLARLAARAAPSKTRFLLTIGRLETSVAFSADGVSMLHASRHLRDVLEARGFDVTLRETSGGHDPHNWSTSLADALVMFLAP